MKLQVGIVLTALCFASPSEAQLLPNKFFDGTMRYSAEINDSGAILKSGDTTLYLGKDCDAYSPQFGQGSWGWANAGFRVVFPQKKQELWISTPREPS